MSEKKTTEELVLMFEKHLAKIEFLAHEIDTGEWQHKWGRMYPNASVGFYALSVRFLSLIEDFRREMKEGVSGEA